MKIWQKIRKKLQETVNGNITLDKESTVEISIAVFKEE